MFQIFSLMSEARHESGRWQSKRFRQIVAFEQLLVAVMLGFFHPGPLHAREFTREDLAPLVSTDLTEVRAVGDRYVSKTKGFTITYTLDPVLQSRMVALLQRYQVPYGAFIALDPRTGRVLALIGVERRLGPSVSVALRASYPAASLFKIITAAAALEAADLHPETEITYRGNPLHLGAWTLRGDPRRDQRRMTLSEALARSSNVVFGKVAVHYLNADLLKRYAQAFGFNRPIPFELPLETSRAAIEDGPLGLARTAAGFGPVMISPLHAAMIAAAVANGGLLMRPYLIERVTDAQGQVLYQAAPEPLAIPIQPTTAGALREMMEGTIRIGTSRRAFRSFTNSPTLGEIPVAGKTGTLSGEDPKGHYEWFAGFAPVPEPEIALAALVINQERWRIKGNFVAREGFAAYFAPGLVGEERAPSPMVRKAVAKKPIKRAASRKRTPRGVQSAGSRVRYGLH